MSSGHKRPIICDGTAKKHKKRKMHDSANIATYQIKPKPGASTRPAKMAGALPADKPTHRDISRAQQNFNSSAPTSTSTSSTLPPQHTSSDSACSQCFDSLSAVSKDQFQRLLARKTEYREAMKEAEKRIEKLRGENASLVKHVDSLRLLKQQSIEQVDQAVNTAREAAALDQAKFKNQKQELDTLKEKYERLKVRKTALVKGMDELSASKVALQMQVETLVKERDDLLSSKQTLEKEQQALVTKKDNLEASLLRRIQAATDDCEKERQARLKEKADLEDEVKVLRAEKDALEKSLEAAEEERKKAQESQIHIADEKFNLEVQVTTLQNENLVLKLKLAETEDTAKSTSERLEISENDRLFLQEDIRNLAFKSEKSLEENESLQNQIGKLGRKNELLSKAARLTQELKRKQQRLAESVEEAKQQREALQMENTRLEDALRSREARENELEDLRKANAKLHVRFNAWRVAADEDYSHCVTNTKMELLQIQHLLNSDHTEELAYMFAHLADLQYRSRIKLNTAVVKIKSLHRSKLGLQQKLEREMAKNQAVQKSCQEFERRVQEQAHHAEAMKTELLELKDCKQAIEDMLRKRPSYTERQRQNSSLSQTNIIINLETAGKIIGFNNCPTLEAFYSMVKNERVQIRIDKRVLTRTRESMTDLDSSTKSCVCDEDVLRLLGHEVWDVLCTLYDYIPDRRLEIAIDGYILPRDSQMILDPAKHCDENEVTNEKVKSGPEAVAGANISKETCATRLTVIDTVIDQPTTSHAVQVEQGSREDIDGVNCIFAATASRVEGTAQRIPPAAVMIAPTEPRAQRSPNTINTQLSDQREPSQLPTPTASHDGRRSPNDVCAHIPRSPADRQKRLCPWGKDDAMERAPKQPRSHDLYPQVDAVERAPKHSRGHDLYPEVERNRSRELSHIHPDREQFHHSRSR